MVVNDPESLRDCNEKLYATAFPDCTPPLVVATREDVLLDFHAEHGDVVFKKLDGMGGTSIFRVRRDDPNLRVVVETLTGNGKTPVMAQQFIPAISLGDKRILLIDGEPVPYALARIPKPGETRGNLAAGGSGVGQPLGERDTLIAARVAPDLRRRGLRFVGIDVIGDFLTEINVTCPTLHSRNRPAIRARHRRRPAGPARGGSRLNTGSNVAADRRRLAACLVVAAALHGVVLLNVDIPEARLPDPMPAIEVLLRQEPFFGFPTQRHRHRDGWLRLRARSGRG